MKKRQSLKQIICTIYLVVIFVVYPLFQKDHYYEMGVHKYLFYLYSTIAFLVFIVFAALTDPKAYKSSNSKSSKNSNKKKNNKAVVEEPEQKKGFPEKLWDGFKTLPNMEKALLIYSVTVVISYIFSVDKHMAFWGADGWQMGLLIQGCMIGAFYALFFFWEKEIYPIAFAMLGSGVVFLLGFLHRFYIDPLNMYEGLDEHYMLEFLSTIGQATWYSSFVCTLFPIGLVLFIVAKSRNVKIIAGVYSAISFATLCTQNSDSAFAALFVVLLLFFWRAFDGKEELKGLLQAVLLMSATFSIVGVLQRIFWDYVIELDKISFFMTKGPLMPAVFVLCLIMYVLLFIINKGKLADAILSARKPLVIIRGIIFGLMVVGIVGYVVFIILNTAGAFGDPNENIYLYLNDYWGNWRGFHWKLTAKMYAEFPWYRKLIGAGPDCYEAMTTQFEPYNTMVNDLFPDMVLSCSHNEFYNMIICYGGIGAIAYACIYIFGFIRFYKASKVEPMFLAVAASIVSYSMHNFFCYQTICCTPFMFIIMAIGAKYIKDMRINEK